ncbi:unnamed protein product [Prorocentrum cordatum]|uniref:Uncharacterized protein n=1 Tax=Prorocentrum cordatum TaxID=2364126 RepID=A0ABN9YFK9_9DINO|nr:unnamed protein product [Polarella glacialis]
MMVESRRRNLALASQGAQLVGELGRCDVQASKPLLRYDVAFPEWPEDLASDQVAGVPGQCEGVRDLPQALPVSFGSAAEFQEHLKSVDAAWEGDCRQSTFLPNPAEVVIRLPVVRTHFGRPPLILPADQCAGAVTSAGIQDCGRSREL